MGMRQSITPATSQKIKNMSLLCAMLVVSIHVHWPTEQALSVGWFMYQGLKSGFAAIAVPFFFIVSGSFLAQHFGEEGWWPREVGKRVKSLVIPFVLWALISLVASVPLSIIADLIAHRPFGTNIAMLHDFDWMRVFGFDLTDYPLHVPLWYVRCLFFFVLTAAVFGRAVASLRYVWLAAAFAFLLLCNHIPNESVRAFFQMGYSASGIFYFSCGIFLRRFKSPRLSTRSAALCGVAGFFLLAAKMYFVYRGWCGATALGKVSLPPLIAFTWHFMSARRLPAWLTACSFPIFLMHTVLFAYIGVFLKRLPMGTLTQAFVMLVGGVVGAIVLTGLIRRVAPRAAAILFGGR